MRTADMFSHTRKFNQDIDAWDTSKVNDMERMFEDATLFNQDIDGWDTSNVVYMLGTCYALRLAPRTWMWASMHEHTHRRCLLLPPPG